MTLRLWWHAGHDQKVGVSAVGAYFLAPTNRGSQRASVIWTMANNASVRPNRKVTDKARRPLDWLLRHVMARRSDNETQPGEHPLVRPNIKPAGAWLWFSRPRDGPLSRMTSSD